MKNYAIIFFFFYICFVCAYSTLHAVTLVYNLRVRRAFNIPFIRERMYRKWPLAAVPIYFSREANVFNARTNLNVCEERRAGGVLLNARYVHDEHWWGEITTGIEKDSAKFVGTDPLCASRTGLDDIVFAGGYRHFFGERIQGILYGIAGFPTRRKVTLNDRFTPLVGTRFYNVGVGAEFSYSFVTTLRRSFSGIVQGRFIHGFNREWFPILPRDNRIQPGNFSDLLCALQYRERRTVFEAGYDLTIFSQQAIITPVQTFSTDTFYRHGVYANFAHLTRKKICNKGLAIGAGGNITRSKQFDAKTYGVWIAVTLIL